jgi:hypothetical protein
MIIIWARCFLALRCGQAVDTSQLQKLERLNIYSLMSACGFIGVAGKILIQIGVVPQMAWWWTIAWAHPLSDFLIAPAA